MLMVQSDAMPIDLDKVESVAEIGNKGHQIENATYRRRRVGLVPCQSQIFGRSRLWVELFGFATVNPGNAGGVFLLGPIGKI